MGSTMLCPGVPFLDAFHLVKEACPHTAERAQLGVAETWAQIPLPEDSGQATALHRASGSNLSDGRKALSSQDSGEESVTPSLGRMHGHPEVRGTRRRPLNGAAPASGVPDVPSEGHTVERTPFSR